MSDRMSAKLNWRLLLILKVYLSTLDGVLLPGQVQVNASNASSSGYDHGGLLPWQNV